MNRRADDLPVAITTTVPAHLRVWVDRRREHLGLKMTEYIRQLIEQDQLRVEAEGTTEREGVSR